MERACYTFTLISASHLSRFRPKLLLRRKRLIESIHTSIRAAFGGVNTYNLSYKINIIVNNLTCI